MITITRRAWILIILYAGALAIGGGYRFFYAYGFTEWQRVTGQIQSFSALLAESEGILAREADIMDEYSRVQEKLPRAQAGENIATDIIQDIKTKAQEAGLNVINIKPFGLKQAARDMYGAFELQLETEGNLVNLGNLLYRLDESPYLFGIKHTQITSHAQGNLLKFQLLLSALVTAS